MKILKDGSQVLLKEIEPGTLFKFNDTIALKSEYYTDEGAVQCYIVGTGEVFWGGVKTPNELNNLLVQPLKIINHVDC